MDVASIPLFIIAAVGLFAAIAGGNVKLPQSEIGPITDKYLRLSLALVSVVFLAVALGLVTGSFDNWNVRHHRPIAAAPTQSPTPGPVHSSTAAITSDGRSRHAQYVLKTVPVCREWGQKMEALLKTSPPSTDQGIASYYEQATNLVGGMSESLKRIPRPADEVEELDKVYDALDYVSGRYQAVKDDMEAGDRSQAEKDYQTVRPAAATYTAKAKAFGLPAACLM